MGVYYDDFANYAALLGAYPEAPPEAQVVYAGYTYEDYNGSAIVVWLDEVGQLWENHDSHCSCYGLENWAPERAVVQAVEKYAGWPGLADALLQALAVAARVSVPAPVPDLPRAVRLRA